MQKSLFTALFLVSVFIANPGISAQSVLQDSRGSLQPQSEPTQTSANTQQQEGTLQTNNGASALNQASNIPLGVVSSPNQTTPEAVVPPSDTLKTDFSEQNSGSVWPYIAAVSGVIALVGILFLRRKPGSQEQEIVDMPIIRPEPSKPKKRRSPAKAKAKPNRRKKKSAKK